MLVKTEGGGGGSIMDNPETLVTLDTQDTGRRTAKQITQHRKLMR
jgi:hypothetical protein